jgi:putative heme-binding domain-containing protein
MRRYRLLALAAAMLSAGALQAQEHSYAPSDIENGRGLYQANCLGCHGNNGDQVEGAALGSGRFRHASNDEELIAVIRGGIPNTLMVAKPQLSYGDLRALVAFLRNMQASGINAADTREVKLGDPKRGEELFFGAGKCNTCHGVGGGGSRLSPDLANIGAQRTPVSLETAILDPRKEVREGQRFMQVTTKAGQTVTGKLLNQDTHSVQLLTEQEQLASYPKADLSAWAIVPSPMPSMLDVLSADQVADLVAYLVSLKPAQEPAK